MDPVNIRELAEEALEWADEGGGEFGPSRHALARGLLSVLDAPCVCDKCRDCLAANRYEAVEAERDRLAAALWRVIGDYLESEGLPRTGPGAYETYRTALAGVPGEAAQARSQFRWTRREWEQSDE